MLLPYMYNTLAYTQSRQNINKTINHCQRTMEDFTIHFFFYLFVLRILVIDTESKNMPEMLYAQPFLTKDNIYG